MSDEKYEGFFNGKVTGSPNLILQVHLADHHISEVH